MKKLLLILLFPICAMAQVTWPFYESGITIQGVNKVNYQDGEDMTFEVNWLNTLGSSRTATWDFYMSGTGTFIKQTTGLTSTTDFTYAQGKDGIDVFLTIDFGIHQTKFAIKRRVVIIPVITTPTRTWNIFECTASGGSVFSGSATASVVNGSATVTTSAAHGASVGDQIVFISGGGTHRTYRAQAGTTGTTIILDRVYEGTTETITNANTKRGTAITHTYDATAWSAGDIVYLKGTLYTNRLRITNMNGSSGSPIWLVNDPNTADTVCFWKYNPTNVEVIGITDNVNHIRFISLKDGSGNYRMKLFGGGMYGQLLSGMADTHNNIRVTMEAKNATSSGFAFKNDTNNRATGGWDDCWVYDCYSHDNVNEGFYLGYNLFWYDSGFGAGGYHHAMDGVMFWANKAHGNGWDGMQISSAPTTWAAYNYCYDNAVSNVGGQNFEFVLNSGFGGHFHNNVIVGNIGALQLFMYKTSYVYNNLIYTPGGDYAVFAERFENRGLGVPSYDVSDVTAGLYMFNNIMHSVQDPIYLVDDNTYASGKVPLAKIRIQNNTGFWSGTPTEGFFRYTETGGSPDISTSDNLTPSTVATFDLFSQVGIKNLAGEDYTLTDESIIFENEGKDISSEVSASALPLGVFVDLTNQIIPVRGYWRQSPIHRQETYESTFDITKTSIQWYQTNQSSVFSDKVKLPEHYGAVIKKSAHVTGSALPKYVVTVKPSAKTGTKYGTETIDNTSN